MFFHEGQPFNQGNIYDFDEDAFINACEQAIERVESDRVNKEGLLLQEEFTYEKTADAIIEQINTLE